MHSTPNRRRFIEILPLAGLGLLAACSDKPAPAPAPAPEPAPAPAPAPVAAPEPPPAPASEAAPAAPATPAEPTPPAAPPATGSAGGLVDEASPQATALGYVADAKRADKVKYPKFVAGSQCNNCALFIGKASDAAGGCPLFPGKQVAAGGWCSAWAKKA